MPKKDSSALRNNDTALRVAKRLSGDLGALAAGRSGAISSCCATPPMPRASARSKKCPWFWA